MTTVEMAQRLLRDIGEKDLSLLAMDVRGTLVDAMNSGIQRYYAKSSSFMRSVPASALLRAPKTVTITVTKGENTFSGYSVSEDDMYNTILIDGDATPNQIVGEGHILDYYMGETGTVSATIYSDCIPIYEPIRRVASDPVLLGNSSRRLIRDQDMDHDECNRINERKTGRPRYYRMDYNARSETGEPPMLIRVDTFPDTDYKLRFDVEMDPLRILLKHLIKPVDVPVRDSHLDAYLIPMIREELASSPMWKNKDATELVLLKGREAEEELEVESFKNAAPQSNEVTTPYGY